MLGQFIDRLAARPGGDRPVVLDLGPICERNLNYFSGDLGWRVRVEDLCRQAGSKALDQAVLNLSLAEDYLDGALVWSMMAHLGPVAADHLTRQLHRALKPGSPLLAVFQGGGQEERIVKPAAKFLIEEENHVRLVPTAYQLPWRRMTNRDVEATLSDFEPLHSYYLRVGLTEYMFRRPPYAKKDRA